MTSRSSSGPHRSLSLLSLIFILFFNSLILHSHARPSLSVVTGSSSTTVQGGAHPSGALLESISQLKFNPPTTAAIIAVGQIQEENVVYPDSGVDDLILSPLLLAVTVDGHVHALKRATGQWVWTLHDDGGAAVGGITKEESAKRTRAGEAVGGPLVRGVIPKLSNNTLLENVPLLPLPEDETMEDEIYVIEPHSAGDIYLYTPSSSTVTSSTLQKLPLSMTQLVALSPFTFPSDNSRMFVGRKETKLVGVDLRSGRLVGVFGSGEGWCEWDEMREGRVRTEEECDEEISRRPEDLLYMARTEYHLFIYSKSPYSLLQTLTYTTYSSSSLGSTLQSQWTRTPDSRYLQPMHDGSLICFQSGVPGLQWTTAFDNPVVAVFDIATPPNPISVDGLHESSQPIMLEQPHPHPVEGLPVAFDQFNELPETTFIGKIGDNLFAMSRANFPLVAFAPMSGSSIMTNDDVESKVSGGNAPHCVGKDCLVGTHLLENTRSPMSNPLIEPPPVRLGIEPPLTTASTTASPDLSSPTVQISPHAPSRSAIILAAMYRPVQKLTDESRFSALAFGFLGLLGWFWGGRVWRAKAVEIGHSVTLRPNLSSTPKPFVKPTLLTLSASLLPYSSAISRDDSKDLPPLPPIRTDDAEGDSDTEAVEDTPKRKSRRRRGKKGKKLNSDGVTPVVLFAEGGETLIETELENLSLVDVVGEMEIDVVDSNLIGGLSVSEVILGYGSHGTVVLRGEFQGRAVAVKRLLKDFVTIATHEVALLQESDDHPNVIRYFCKEQRDTFLYIALELCPASLYELIDQPNSFPELTRDFDLKKALRQITGGIRHLHKLKIVHRDIKPQNILVSPTKAGGVRMLISDFGLCKKLDLDESSFQQTVNHAAGSFGYRAPEVLRGQVDPNEGAPGTPSNSTAGSRSGSNGSTSGTNTDPSMRLTRSIDIFSLGCIFYYVLTGGEHPFGGRYEREMNILRGKVSLERLDGLGEEAFEVQDAITRMVASNPRERPTAEAVLLHPFFWNAQKRLLFICDASDRFEIMEREPPTPTLVVLEAESSIVVGDDWSKSIDRSLLDNLGKYRKYDVNSVRDLLRVLRNKKHHYQDLPDNVRRNLGDLPGGFLSYFTTRFPRLLLHVYDVVALHLADEPMFASTFSLPDDEQ